MNWRFCLRSIVIVFFVFSASFGLVNAQATTTQNATPPSANTSPTITSDAKACSVQFPGGFSFLTCADYIGGWIIKHTLLYVAGWFLWAAASLLDYIVNVGILGFSDWAPAGLYPLWQVIRQMVSMFVVFAGLYLGFMYIINRGDQFKRYIPWIVIFGLFVNFSYPATRALIDISNIISLDIYASAIGTDATLLKNQTASSGGLNQNSAGTIIMKSLGLQGLVSLNDSFNFSDQGEVANSITSYPAALLIVAYVIYAGYIFFMASLLLMLRTLALSFIIVASPILFVDAVIPKLGDMAQKLRKIFFEQLALSVVFMVMLYLCIAMTRVISTLKPGGLNASSIVQIFNVLMMLILLHITIKVTKQVAGTIGEKVSQTVGQFGSMAAGAAIGVATGGTGLLARQTIGAAAANWAKSDTLKNAQGSWIGRRAMDMSKSLANSSFDLRNTGMGMTVAGAMGGAAFAKGFDRSGRLEGYEKAKAARQEKFEKDKLGRLDMMTDEKKKHDYLNDNTLGKDNDAVKEKFAEAEREKMKKEAAEVASYASADTKTRLTMAGNAKNNPKLLKQMGIIDAFDKFPPEQIEQRVGALQQLNDIDQAKNVIENSKFKDLEDAQAKEIAEMERELSMIVEGSDLYKIKKADLQTKKIENKEKIDNLKKQMVEMLNAASNVDIETKTGEQKLDLDLTEKVGKEDFAELIKKIKTKQAGGSIVIPKSQPVAA